MAYSPEHYSAMYFTKKRYIVVCLLYPAYRTFSQSSLLARLVSILFRISQSLYGESLYSVGCTIISFGRSTNRDYKVFILL